jgi:peptide/nickel transport system ATP-binding protein
VQSQILNLLQDLKRAFGLTYVLISHNLAVIEHIATRVAVMYLGQVVEEGETEALFRNPKHPYTQALLRAALPPVPADELPEPLGGSFPSAMDPPSGCAFHPRCSFAFERCKVERPELLLTETGLVRCHLYEAGDAASAKFPPPSAESAS